MEILLFGLESEGQHAHRRLQVVVAALGRRMFLFSGASVSDVSKFIK
jgi:hypothetical protein